MKQTSPLPIFRALAKLRSKSVPFHVSANGQEVLIALDRKRFKASLIQMAFACRVVVGVVSLGVCQDEPLSKTAHFPVHIRADTHVPVIGHQTKREQANIEAFNGLGKHRFKSLEVLIFVKDLCAQVRAI